LSELARLISEWPGLVSGPADHLVEDSLVLLEHLGDAKTLVDVGSGGGLPGLPLKLARPDIAVTLVEADSGKAAFLVQACARLGLTGVEVPAMRAEHSPLCRRWSSSPCHWCGSAGSCLPRRQIRKRSVRPSVPFGSWVGRSMPYHQRRRPPAPPARSSSSRRPQPHLPSTRDVQEFRRASPSKDKTARGSNPRRLKRGSC